MNEGKKIEKKRIWGDKKNMIFIGSDFGKINLKQNKKSISQLIDCWLVVNEINKIYFFYIRLSF